MLVEDNRVMLDALTYVVGQESGLQLVATAADAEEAVTAGRRTQPQVVVMDIRLPGRDGIDATRELCRELPDVRVVILSVTCTRRLIREAFGAGACGYLVKDGSHRQLVDAIHFAADGGCPLTHAARRLLEVRRGPGLPPGQPSDGRRLETLR
jgi:DNA-binding NarL/FixJ family response regulator